MNKYPTVAIITMIALAMIGIEVTVASQSTEQKRPLNLAEQHELSINVAEQKDQRAAPIAISGDDMYITWWTNETGNDEVHLRSSDDGGATFADKINLSNSTNADSVDAEIVADFSNVLVSWWERNDTGSEPVARISNDKGLTFGPILKLATNGTIGPAG